MYFDYSKGLRETFYREGAYLPGQPSATTKKFVESANSYYDNGSIQFGQVLKRVIDAEKNLPYVMSIEEDDSAVDFYGIAVRDAISQSIIEKSKLEPQIISGYGDGHNISVMLEGFISVPVQSGVVVDGNPVWVRTMTSLVNPYLPIGGIEAEAAVGNQLFKGAYFRGYSTYPTQGLLSEPTSTSSTMRTAVIELRNVEYGIVPTISTAPTVSDIEYGQAASEATITGGVAKDGDVTVVGKFILNNPNKYYNVGTYDVTCSFIPNDIDTYETVSNVEVSITVDKVSPVITGTPIASGEIESGAELSTIGLLGGTAINPNNNVEIDGAFDWTLPETVVTESGEQDVTFSPIDSDNYYDKNDIEVDVTVASENI